MSNTPKPLPRVTLWSCAGRHGEINRVVKVLQYCETLFQFGQTVLFSAIRPPNIPAHWQWHEARLGTRPRWNLFHIREVPNHISNTDFALSVHEDGFILNPDLWTDDWYQYDYIGAPWKDGIVGNGGFCLESRKLLAIKSQLEYKSNGNLNSDWWLCRVVRKEAEELGVKFAPLEVALKFSTETRMSGLPSFGFHGRSYSRQKYKRGWSSVKQASRLLLNSPYPAPSTQLTRAPQPVEPVPLKDGTNVAVVYVYPIFGETHDVHAARFVGCYKEYHPTYPHKLYIVSNGGPPTAKMEQTMSGLGHTFVEHDDTGWDIGAYRMAAGTISCDLMVFFGGSSFMRHSGWLERMVESFQKHGPAIYGASGNTGVIHYKVWRHIRTTGFWMPPGLMRGYPHTTTSERDSRFAFEHGPHNLTVWLMKSGYQAWVVNWHFETEWPDWKDVPNSYNRGDQSEMIVFDRMSEPPFVTLKPRMPQ